VITLALFLPLTAALTSVPLRRRLTGRSLSPSPCHERRPIPCDYKHLAWRLACAHNQSGPFASDSFAEDERDAVITGRRRYDGDRDDRATTTRREYEVACPRPLAVLTPIRLPPRLVIRLSLAFHLFLIKYARNDPRCTNADAPHSSTSRGSALSRNSSRKQRRDVSMYERRSATLPILDCLAPTWIQLRSARLVVYAARKPRRLDPMNGRSCSRRVSDVSAVPYSWRGTYDLLKTPQR